MRLQPPTDRGFQALYDPHHTTVPRSALRGSPVVRPSHIRALLASGIVAAPLGVVLFGELWIHATRGDWSIAALALWGIVGGGLLVFLSWAFGFGNLNYGVLLAPDAVYVFHGHVRTRQLSVVRILWEDLLYAKMTGFVGKTVTVHSNGPSIDLSPREAKALLGDSRYREHNQLSMDVQRRLHLSSEHSPGRYQRHKPRE